MTCRCPVLAMLNVTLAVAGAAAAPFDARVIGGDAKFVVFNDCDAGRETAIGKAFVGHLLADEGYAEFEKSLTEWAGFTPSQDVHDITIFGDSLAKDVRPVIIIHAVFDAVQLRSLFALLPGFESRMYADHEVLNWPDHGRRLYLSIFDEHTLAISNDPTNLARAIDVLIDPSKSIESNKEFPRPYRLDETSGEAPGDEGFFFAAAVGLGSSPDFAKNAVLAKIDVASLKVRAEKGKTIAVATSAAGSPADVEKLFNFVTGLKAIAGLAPAPQPATRPTEQQWTGELARTVQLAHDDHAVTATLAVTDERAAELLKGAVEINRQRKAEP